LKHETSIKTADRTRTEFRRMQRFISQVSNQNKHEQQQQK